MNLLKPLGGLAGLLIFGGLFWYRMSQADAVDARVDECHEICVQALLQCDPASKHTAFFEEFEPEAHESAYDTAYTPGARRRSPSFDEALYCSTYFKFLQNRARLKNLAALDVPLREAQIAAEREMGS